MELVNVGGWLTHSDGALVTRADLLVVTEHRLVTSRVQKKRQMASPWSLARQDSSQVSRAGVGLVW